MAVTKNVHHRRASFSRDAETSQSLKKYFLAPKSRKLTDQLMGINHFHFRLTARFFLSSFHISVGLVDA